jgi:hypothetical protein
MRLVSCRYDNHMTYATLISKIIITILYEKGHDFELVGKHSTSFDANYGWAPGYLLHNQVYWLRISVTDTNRNYLTGNGAPSAP